ncbi:efflux transporter periplasmic adaptor subunit [Seongchinamella sediminis]|uniref:Efflux transporter periplasmic adaptor subunit n=1 Tax=Seongchinamella sediminis TaxID=2283635 RepID=A0A3L7DXB3_9GAMM|nr:efflux transporter periplasmic adaptor subunit [Seongchinamella sediminis]RLQ21964.1 efflux transporter periplasmic adaptor subunit [Seongchinamella sediminis]
MTRKNKLMLAIALVTGIAFVVLMVKFRQAPERSQAPPSAIPVRILQISPQVFHTEAHGYGQVMPAQSWNAVANVGGRIIWKHPELESGSLVPAGTRLLEIDPGRYQLALDSTMADLAGIEAERRQLEQEEHNTRELLQLEESRLALASRELERAKTLSGQGALSQTRLDEQQRATLQQQHAVQSLQNQLRLIPLRRETLAARKTRLETVLASAQEDLKDTRFEAPWNMRIHQAKVDTGQHVSPGQTLFVADNISRAEATVQLEVAELRRVLSQLTDTDRPAPANRPAGDFTDFHRTLPLHQLEVWVTPTSMPDTRWSGRLTRVTSSLDSTTRTVQAVISVEEPYRNARPPARPPLVRNMFVQATLSAPTPKPVIAVPVSAVHQGVVYLVSDDARLQRQPVTLAWQQGDVAIIADGLAAGDRLILDDLVPAIDGTPLAPHVEEPASMAARQPGAEKQP